MLEAGVPAPAFSLPDADMEPFDLIASRGRHVIVFFYPKDDTPGCTLEAAEFSDHEEEFARHGCLVVGISRDDCFKHAEFRDKHGLSVRLLSDAEGEVCRMYGVWKAREVDGHKRMGIVRSTFVIDRNGIVRHAFYGINPRGHVMEMLELVKQMERQDGHARREKHRRHTELPRIGSGREPH